MDDKRIEELLQTAWTPVEPAGMRERILNPRETKPLGRRSALRVSWRTALIGAAIAVVLYCGVADHNRQTRLCATMCTSDARTSTSVCSAAPFGFRRDMARLLAEDEIDLSSPASTTERSTL